MTSRHFLHRWFSSRVPLCSQPIIAGKMKIGPFPFGLLVLKLVQTAVTSENSARFLLPRLPGHVGARGWSLMKKALLAVKLDLKCVTIYVLGSRISGKKASLVISTWKRILLRKTTDTWIFVSLTFKKRCGVPSQFRPLWGLGIVVDNSVLKIQNLFTGYLIFNWEVSRDTGTKGHREPMQGLHSVTKWDFRISQLFLPICFLKCVFTLGLLVGRKISYFHTMKSQGNSLLGEDFPIASLEPGCMILLMQMGLIRKAPQEAWKMCWGSSL